MRTRIQSKMLIYDLSTVSVHDVSTHLQEASTSCTVDAYH